MIRPNSDGIFEDFLLLNFLCVYLAVFFLVLGNTED
jgi:hypothetical protein